MARPPVPPCSNPRFQPKYIPEITYPTPNPQRRKGLRILLRAGAGNGMF
jgi:hypothetical protein